MNNELVQLMNLYNELLENITSLRKLIDSEEYSEIDNILVARTKILKKIIDLKAKIKEALPNEFEVLAEKIKKLEKENIQVLEERKKDIRKKITQVGKQQNFINAYTGGEQQQSGGILNVSE